MREFKFRAWDKWQEKMFQPNDGDFIGWHGPSNWKACYELMQYTGLKDKNGKEIYEGDMVDHEFYGYGIVRWVKAGGFAIQETDVPWNLEIVSESMEVIGNIYQHPEPLKDNSGSE